MEFYLVDAFTDSAFAGNSAAVVLLDGPAEPEWMQSVAAEFKHPETAFVEVTGTGVKPLRWFTPVTEVDLCGHATLATAHVLGDEQAFSTRSGELRCRDAGDGWIAMDFPADSPREAADDLSRALPGARPEQVVRGTFDLLVRLPDAEAVRAVRPDLAAVAELDARGLIVTAPGAEPGIDFVSRFFAPASGVDEDPVTGSAHCLLAPLWAQRLGRTELTGHQISARGGVVRIELNGERVQLSGRAVTVARGELMV